MTLWIIIGIIIVVVLFVIMMYNNLVREREMVRNAMGNISAQIESRWDAVKNLIDATKQYSEHEAKVLTDITDKRTGVNRSSNVADVEREENLFTQAMDRINVVMENYPQLKASDVYVRAMDAVDGYENKVRMSRMVYNDSVTKLNRRIQQFPTNLFAGLFGFTQEEYFSHSTEKSEVPKW